MNEQIRIYHKEDFYKGMAAIVSQTNWHQLSAGNAVMVASKATAGACNHGDINNAFVQLCDEKKRREVPSSKAAIE